MSVDIEPSELGFRRPFTTEVAETLKIRNPNSTPVAFKVKTTAPKQYCVRPNSGRIEPDREVEVTVLLQAMKQDPPSDFKCRDKFLVQSVPITGDKDFTSVGEIWDRAQKSDVQEKKIRVSFLVADDPDAAAPATTPIRRTTNGFDATPEAVAPTFTSPREESRGANGMLSPQAPSPEVATSSRDVRSSSSATQSVGGASSAAVAPAAAPVSSIRTTPANDKDATIATLTAKLAEAEALVSSLRKDGGLRQRKGAAAATGPSEKSVEASGTATTPQRGQVVRGTEGVPVQIVAILCLLCFLLAYFFF